MSMVIFNCSGVEHVSLQDALYRSAIEHPPTRLIFNLMLGVTNKPKNGWLCKSEWTADEAEANGHVLIPKRVFEIEMSITILRLMSLLETVPEISRPARYKVLDLILEKEQNEKNSGK